MHQRLILRRHLLKIHRQCFRSLSRPLSWPPEIRRQQLSLPRITIAVRPDLNLRIKVKLGEL